MTTKISFGATLDKNTIDFIAQARKKGLKIDEMELLMKKVVPTEIIETAKNKDGFISMGIGKYSGGYSLKTLLKPNFVYYRKRDKLKIYPQYMNQKTIDKITKKLKELQKNESMGIYPKAYITELHRRYGKTIDF